MGLEDRYDPGKIARISGQEGPITAREGASAAETEYYLDKARVMAQEEAKTACNTMAQLYQGMLERDGDQEKVGQYVMDNIEKFNEIGGAFNGVQYMDMFKANNIPPEHIRRFGELEAEVAGLKYDWTQQFRSMSDSELDTAEQRAMAEEKSANAYDPYPRRVTDFGELLNGKIRDQLPMQKVWLIRDEKKRRSDEREKIGYRITENLIAMGLMSKKPLEERFVPETRI